MTPLIFAATCLALVPAVVAVSAGVTVAWAELVFLPRIAGDE